MQRLAAEQEKEAQELEEQEAETEVEEKEEEPSTGVETMGSTGPAVLRSSKSFDQMDPR